MANKFVVWIPTPTVGTNIQSQETFAGDSQTETGFKAGDPASAIRVNTAIRQANLVACALMNVLIPNNTTLSVESSVGDLANELGNHLSVDLNLFNGTGAGSIKSRNGGTASGQNSVSLGYNNVVAHLCAIALGANLTSGADYQTIVGRWNSSLNNALFVVGAGTDVNNKSNALVVFQDGSVRVFKAPSDANDVARKYDIPIPTSSTPSNVASSGSVGSSSDFARADHTHKGVTSVSVNNNTYYGDVPTIYAPQSVGSYNGQLVEWNENHGIARFKVGTVGSSVKPIYIDTGVPTESSGTVGSANQPIYLDGGEIKAGNKLFEDGIVSTPLIAGLYAITVKKTTNLYDHYATVVIRTGQNVVQPVDAPSLACSSVGIVDDGTGTPTQFYVSYEADSVRPTQTLVVRLIDGSLASGISIVKICRLSSLNVM